MTRPRSLRTAFSKRSGSWAMVAAVMPSKLTPPVLALSLWQPDAVLLDGGQLGVRGMPAPGARASAVKDADQADDGDHGNRVFNMSHRFMDTLSVR